MPNNNNNGNNDTYRIPDIVREGCELVPTRVEPGVPVREATLNTNIPTPGEIISAQQMTTILQRLHISPTRFIEYSHFSIVPFIPEDPIPPTPQEVQETQEEELFESIDREISETKRDYLNIVQENNMPNIERCTLCGERIDADELIDLNGNLVCSWCREHAEKCDICGDYQIETYPVRKDGETHYYCCKCLADHSYVSCAYCGNLVEDSTLVEIEGKKICDECLEKQTTICPRCETRVFSNGMTRVNFLYDNVQTQQTVCRECANRDFTQCTHCEERVFTEHMLQDPSNGRMYCPECFDCRNIIQQYNFVPKFKKYLARGEKEAKNTLFIGVELEIEDIEGRNRGSHNKIANRLAKKVPFVYFMHDGSIGHGFEIATMPLSWRWIRENETEFDPIFDLRKDSFRSFDTQTCGMHIHLSKSAFSNLSLYKFLTFFYKFPHFIVLISQRGKLNKLDQYAKLTSSYPIKIRVRNKGADDEERKYTAVNLRHQDTVEVRVFRGTLNPASFFKNIEFCKAVMEFSKTNSLKEINVENFCKYVQGRKKEYHRLYKFLGDYGLFTNKDLIKKYSSSRYFECPLAPEEMLSLPFNPREFNFLQEAELET